MNDDDVLELAQSRGIDIHWVDTKQVERRIEPATARQLLDVLGPQRHPEHHEPVVVWAIDDPCRLTVSGRVVHASLTIDPRVRSDDSPCVISTRQHNDHSLVSIDPSPGVGRHAVRLTMDDEMSETVTIFITPHRNGLPSASHGLSLFVPAYAMRSGRSAPVGGLPELRQLGRGLSGSPVGSIATLPLYATFTDGPHIDASPYSPVSREHWNELFADTEGLAGPDGEAALSASLRARADELSSTDMVDWAAANQWTAAVFDRALEVPELYRRVKQWSYNQPSATSYAHFRAALHDRGMRPRVGESLHDYEHDPVAMRHLLGQMLMEDQLAALEDELRGEGQSLALDLPVGSHPQGWETWRYSSEFAFGATVGAPPDDFFSEGQNWGFVPLHPQRSRRCGHEVWHQVVDTAAKHTSMLRIDHVMAVERLWWIPEGADPTQGAYVRFPSEEIWAELVITSFLRNTVVVGEDLGTVSPEVREDRRRNNILGMYEEQFTCAYLAPPEVPGDTTLPEVPGDTVAGLRTHDMMPMRAFFEGSDHALRESLSLPQPDRLDERRERVERWRVLLESQLGHPIDDDPASLSMAAIERLSRSSAPIVSLDLDDLLGETAPHNVPGVPHYPGAWRRRLPIDVGRIVSSDTLRTVLVRIGEWRGDAPSLGIVATTVETPDVSPPDTPSERTLP